MNPASLCLLIMFIVHGPFLRSHSQGCVVHGFMLVTEANDPQLNSIGVYTQSRSLWITQWRLFWLNLVMQLFFGSWWNTHDEYTKYLLVISLLLETNTHIGLYQFGLLKENEEPIRNSCRHRENMQTSHKKLQNAISGN